MSEIKHWSAKKPVKDGLYWFRGEVAGYGGQFFKVDSTVVRVETDFEDEPMMYFIGTESSTRFSESKGEWQGPIFPHAKAQRRNNENKKS